MKENRLKIKFREEEFLRESVMSSFKKGYLVTLATMILSFSAGSLIAEPSETEESVKSENPKLKFPKPPQPERPATPGHPEIPRPPKPGKPKLPKPPEKPIEKK